ncbi:hypothetical protein CJF31_00006302 [Rutstroemia sp. NJR-2017a BVV2]|nr:hypothetical protein CJF31_00006302 [Rutstroemia sp. NJR-2017a BVV2]
MNPTTQDCRCYLREIPVFTMGPIVSNAEGKLGRSSSKRTGLDQSSRRPPPPENDLRDALYYICQRLKKPHHTITPAIETLLIDVSLEFVGNRAGADTKAADPDLPEVDKLKVLENEYENDFTILFFLWRGPIVRSTHSAVPANRIVLAGNSAGANLCLALTKFLLEYEKNPLKQKLLFHGREVALLLPAGLTMCSGWADTCDVIPSWRDPNADDILGILQPALLQGYPTDKIWPSNPPREHSYCSAVMLDHELVCPAAVRDWTGAPPMWFALGSRERGIDGNRVVASQAARYGVNVQWVEYENMPHEFMVILGALPQSKHYFEKWSNVCKEFVEMTAQNLTKFAAEKTGKSQALRFKMPNCVEVENLGDITDISPLSFEEVRRRMQKANSERPVWIGGSESSKYKAMI